MGVVDAWTGRQRRCQDSREMKVSDGDCTDAFGLDEARLRVEGDGGRPMRMKARSRVCMA